MKISYRDKILLIILVVLITGFLGYIFLIKPKMEDIESNKSKYSAAEEKQEEVNQKIKRLKVVNNQIIEYEAKSENITSRFLSHRHDFDTDRFVQEMLNNNQMELSLLNISNIEIVDLKPYKVNIPQLSYPLYDGKPATYSSDINKDSANNSDTSGFTPLPAYSITVDFEGNQTNVENFFVGLCKKEQMSVVVEEYISSIDNTGKTKGTIKFKVFFLNPREIVNDE